MSQLIAPSPRPLAIAIDAARKKLEEVVERGRHQAEIAVKRLEAIQPVDRLIRASALEFAPAPDAKGVVAIIENKPEPLHRNALRQIATRASMPIGFIEHLREQGSWGAELAARSLSTIFRETFDRSDERFLVRSAESEIRAVLSSRYKPMDAAPLVSEFLRAAADCNAVPFDAHVLDVRVALRAIVPVVWEPAPGEAVVVGVSFGSSDFGCGGLSISAFIMRLACLNGLTMQTVFKKIHLGRELDRVFDFSARTRQLDQRALASALRDVVHDTLMPRHLEELKSILVQAHREPLKSGELESLLRRHATKNEMEMIGNALETPDVVHVPPGRTRWSLAQAVSWAGQRSADPERRLELEALAGSMLTVAGRRNAASAA